MRPNSRLMKSSLTGALAGLLFGIDMVVISGVIDTVTRLYGLGSMAKGLTVAVSPVGTVLGCFAAGVLGQRMGSRAALRWAAALYVLAALGSTFSFGWPMLLTTRFIGGLAVGAATVLGPVYITELAPAAWRGRLVASFQLMVVTGILLGYTSNFLVRLAGLGAIEWRVMLSVALLPALILLAALFRIPPSPRFLIAQGKTDEALAIMTEMGALNAREELAAIRAAMMSEDAVAHEPVLRWKHRLPLFLAISIGAFNQLSGVNAILMYQGTIFKAAGFSQLSGDAQAIAIGLANLIFTLVGMSLIDRFGRKSLLLVGAVFTTLCLLGVAWIFHTNSHQSLLIALLVGFIGFFALSQGAVIWVYLGEIFPTSVRAKGQGVGSASHWIVNTLLALVFPTLVLQMGKETPFLFFAAATVVQFVVVLFFYPETKGQTLEELQQKLVR